MHRLFEIAKANSQLKFWINQLYRGIEEYFPQPEQVSTHRLQQVLYWKTIDTRRRKHEAIWEPRMEKLFAAVGREVAASYRGSRSVGGPIAVVNRALKGPFQKMMQELQQEVEPDFLRHAPDSLKRKDEWDTVTIWDIDDLVTWNRDTTAAKVTMVSDFTKDWIRGVIDRGAREGNAINEIADWLEGGYAFSRTRAMMIARTEVIGASNAATHFGLKKFMPMDAGGTKDWLATGDRRTRPTHVTAGGNQKDIPYDKPFEVGGSKLMFPGDGSMGAAAKEVIQCRCTSTYHLPKVPQFRKPPRAAPKPPALPRVPKPPRPKPSVPKPVEPPPPTMTAQELHDLKIKNEVDAIVDRLLAEARATGQSLRIDELLKMERDLLVNMRAAAGTNNFYELERTLTTVRQRLVFQLESMKQKIWDAFQLPKNERAKLKLRIKSNVSLAQAQNVETARDFLEQYIRKDGVINSVDYRRVDLVDPKSVYKDRSYAQGTDIYMSPHAPVRTAVHELGHTLENVGSEWRGTHWSSRYNETLTDYRKVRAEGAKPEKLKDLFPGSGYQDSEITTKDKFLSPYVGKVYDNNHTEILSMTVEEFYANPVNLLLGDDGSLRIVMRILREGKRP